MPRIVITNARLLFKNESLNAVNLEETLRTYVAGQTGVDESRIEILFPRDTDWGYQVVNAEIKIIPENYIPTTIETLPRQIKELLERLADADQVPEVKAYNLFMSNHTSSNRNK